MPKLTEAQKQMMVLKAFNDALAAFSMCWGYSPESIKAYDCLGKQRSDFIDHMLGQETADEMEAREKAASKRSRNDK